MPAAHCAGSAGWAAPDTAEARYRVVVALDEGLAGKGGLEPGMRVDAVILLERRRLVDWLFEPAARASRG